MEIWRFIIKLPLIFAHIGLAFAMKKFVTTRFDAKTGMKLFIIILSWSFFIYIGAMWGQINTLTTLLTFLAFYFAIKQKTFKSAFFLGTSITLKIFPLVAIPAFFAYFLKNRSKNETTKFLLMTCFVPIIFTTLVFIAFNWDIMFFLRTVFYSTPVLENNPVQILSGCMNIWSFLAFLSIDIGTQWFFRLLWIPILAVASLFLLRTKKMDEYKFSLSIVSLYILFMISYGWISEQSFLEPLPFIFLILFLYRPKKIQVYLLVIIQIFIYLFSLVNWGPAIFEPLVERFFPTFLGTIDTLNPSTSSLVWTIRGVLGLSVSLFLGLFMILLLKQDKEISLSKKISAVS
jgi:Gpi18-like mannosyltransferase